MEPMTELRDWVERFCPACRGSSGLLQLQAITGDAGFRQYFRVNTSPGLIAVYAPPLLENTPAFVAKDLAMRTAGVGVPLIYGVDFHRGFMLQEDLGDGLLLPLLNDESMPGLYDAAESMLLRIQDVSPDPGVFPPYDRELLLREMELFPEWFVGGLLGQEITPADRQLLDETFESLIASALEQPRVVVHRDYHSRNLLLKADGSIGVVDFQDGVAGPFTYDLVSLLKDCYIRWPASIIRTRALAFLANRADGLDISGVAPGQLLQWFDLMGLQRHIKVLGIFARLWLRDGKARYLDDLPLVLRYTLEVTREYPGLARFDQWFSQRLLPLLPTQSWYRPWQTAGDTP